MHQKGICGDREHIDTAEELTKETEALVALIKASNYTVVFTGAGISTSAGIPDFRGPTGVWTRELKGDKLSPEEADSLLFDKAKPTFTHYALVHLLNRGNIHHIISQNVDGLHLRSGVAAEHLSELHGNIYMEHCESCGKSYFREKDVGGMGLQYTGNLCEIEECSGKLKDFAVDWDTELPKDIFSVARTEIRKADLVICLGTSLRIRPAGNMPLSVTKPNKHRHHAGKLAIINLQATHLDAKAAVRIHYYCDTVMSMLCDRLGVFVDSPLDELPLLSPPPPPPPSQPQPTPTTKKKTKKRKRTK